MKKIFKKLKSIDFGTIVRTVLLLLTWLNQALILIGGTPWAVTPLYLWLSLGSTILITAINYWYNNSWTDFAQMAEDIYHILKDGKVTKEELEEFILTHHGGRNNQEDEVDTNDIERDN